VLLLLIASLGGCGLFRKPITGDNEPTIASLKDRSVPVLADRRVVTDEERTAAAYRAFLAAAPQAPQRPEAMRRLGDLEMDSADRKLAEGAQPDYKAAIARYETFLKAYPQDPGNDRVLYQLARAQEQGGELEVALKTLSRMVREHPATATLDEAQFRRGELLFATRDYVNAEGAYAKVLESERETPYRQRALYMQGWSRFKQGRLDDALRPFFAVLDAKLGSDNDLSHGDKELVEDTFRVTSIALENLQGAASIAPLIDSDTRRSYEDQVYQNLGELYLRQDRVKDAADAFAAFARLRPLHRRAPVLQARVIEIYAANGFATLALEAKKDYVARYGPKSEFQRANPEGWQQTQALVKTHLTELARHHHAAAQRKHESADVQEAVRWYRATLEAFPDDGEAAQSRFLLAELLFEDKRFADAAVEYELVAYTTTPPHGRSADAGYAALLSYAEQSGEAAQRQSVASALRFADRFGGDPRAGGVLTRAAEQLFALQEGTQAAGVARRALATNPPPAERRTAWTVIAHEAFDRKAWAEAEQAYGEVLAQMPDNASGRNALVERLAAAVYQQGESARAAGKPRDAVSNFARVARVAPGSPVRATAQFDAATALLGIQDWEATARLLEDFRERFPGHALQAEVGGKLATAYLAQKQWTSAAGEFERVAATAVDPEVSRGALWQAAELHDKADDAFIAKSYEAYLKRFPQPLDPAVQARARLAQLSSGERSLAWWKELVQEDASGGGQRTERTRALAARGTLALAAPSLEAYRKVSLIEPLAKQLKLKKARLEDVLKAYAAAADFGVAEISTAATFHTAALYQDFGQSLIGSQRPKKLSKAELEQYNVMLEEQAFPFEEKAIALHEANARRASSGLYDEWVKASFSALGKLKPVRWGKAEREDPASPHNQRGIALRGQGEFTQAREAYEQAMTIDPKASAPVLNLAILNDLYLGNPARALALYELALGLSASADPTLTRWVAELKQRKPETAAVVSRKDTP
jgi:tetratricopeptide (TPR) repeat protein